MNLLRILGTFIVFYIFHACHWWACFAIGTTVTETATWYFVGIFVYTVLFFVIMLISGRSSNRKKLFIDYLRDQISEAKAEVDEAIKLEEKERE